MDFKNLLVGNFAKKSAIITNLSETIGYVINNMIKFQVRRFPIITGEGNLVGIITATDILRCMYEVGNHEFIKKQVSEIMTTDLITARSDEALQNVILTMYNSGISGIPVISDENVDGIFTERDIIQTDEIWDFVPNPTIIGDYGIGRLIHDDDVVTENHTLWQVADKIIQTGTRQVLYYNTQTKQYSGVITILSILNAVVSSIISKTPMDESSESIDLQTTGIQVIVKQPIEKLNTPIKIQDVRRYMIEKNLEAVPLFDFENAVILVTEKDLIGYVSNNLKELATL